MFLPLKYVGAILPAMSSSRFVTSVFYNVFTNRYFVQQQAGEKIGRFKRIKVPKNLLRVKSGIWAKENDRYVYSFCIGKTKDVLCGDRRTIEKQLIRIVNSEKLNVHSKLMVSSFLNLDGKTVQLVEESNQDLEQKGIHEKIDLRKFFEKASRFTQQGSNLIDLIHTRYETFKELNDTIHFRDIACINEDKAYFDNKFIEAKEIIKKNLLTNRVLNEMISDIITFCSSKQMIDLRKLFTSDETYEFMLESEYVTLDQKDIERFLSTAVQQNKLGENQSILNVGIELDKELYEVGKPVHVNSTPDQNSEKALMESFSQITEAQLV